MGPQERPEPEQRPKVALPRIGGDAGRGIDFPWRGLAGSTAWIEHALHLWPRLFPFNATL
jgi:hypothetical protein